MASAYAADVLDAAPRSISAVAAARCVDVGFAAAASASAVAASTRSASTRLRSAFVTSVGGLSIAWSCAAASDSSWKTSRPFFVRWKSSTQSAGSRLSSIAPIAFSNLLRVLLSLVAISGLRASATAPFR